MGNEWTKHQLGEIIEVIGGGTPKRSETAYWGGGIPWLSVKDFNNDYRKVFSAEESISELGLKNSSTKLLESGQIIISARGTVGALAQVALPMAFNQSCYGVQGKANLLTNDYLYYLLKHSIERLQKISHGAVFDTITRDTFEHIDVTIPPHKQQKAIAHILGTLDDKIELNRQTNQTLEAMAQALFKSWFVDFDPVIDNALAAGKAIPEALQSRAKIRAQLRAQGNAANTQPASVSDYHQHFPDEFTFTEQLGWIPKGWEVKRSEGVATVSIGKTPPRKLQECFSKLADGNWPWVSIKDLGSSGMFANTTSEYLTPDAVEQYNVKIVPKNTILLSFKLTVGRVAIASRKTATNEAIAHFYNLVGGVNHYYLYQYLRCFDYNSLGSTSSIATAVNSKTIKAMPILVASKLAAQKFASATEGWFTKIMSIENETMTLTKLRDTLLPKLISGELRIPDAEKLLAEAGV